MGTNIDNMKRYCLVTFEDPSLNNMYAYRDDGVNVYHLDDIAVQCNVIRDGQEYTVWLGLILYWRLSIRLQKVVSHFIKLKEVMLKRRSLT